MAQKQTGTAMAPAQQTTLSVLDNLPEDVRADLLRAQQESIGDEIDLPRIKIAGAAVGVYQFPDDDATVKEFSGIILGAHNRNVLWTRAADEQTDDPADARPACSSEDGKWGRPQEGFVHANLGRPAKDGDLVKCAECVYNKFGTGNTFIATKKPRGKAVTNQKAIYVYLPDRALPFVLTLSTMSIAGYDEYVTKLLRRGIPVQAVVTTFKQTIKGEGANKYAIATFHDGDPLDAESFNAVMKMRSDFLAKIEPAPPAQRAEGKVVTETKPVDPTLEEEADADFTVEQASAMPVGDKPPF